MSQLLTSNEWGFSVAEDNPFAIFRVLQKIAADSVGADNVVDLSRGDPGYGFTPGARGRRFYSYLLELDTFLNNEQRRFGLLKREDFGEVRKEIIKFTDEIYSEETAKALLSDLNEFTDRIKEIALSSGREWEDYDVFHAIFNNCVVSGGSYLNPQGELITRLALADFTGKYLPGPAPKPEEFVLFNGASHAIGVIFKALGAEGLNYLNDKATVALCSPAYFPYNKNLSGRGIETFIVPINPVTGDLSVEGLENLEFFEGNLSAMILIDPNNPTGFSLSADSLERLARIAKAKNSLVITDEVYNSFFPKRKTMADFCPERLVRIDSRSKVERSTGLRFGDMYISNEANEYISREILRKGLVKFSQEESPIDFRSFILQAKAPGGCGGEFQHTTFVPGPSQMLGLAHMILGQEERDEYLKAVKSNGEVFIKELGLPHEGNMYYVIFDLNKVSGITKTDVPIEEKLCELAKLGVVFLPAYLFFSEQERGESDLINSVRASVVNTSRDKVAEAARITKKYLTS